MTKYTTPEELGAVVAWLGLKNCPFEITITVNRADFENAIPNQVYFDDGDDLHDDCYDEGWSAAGDVLEAYRQTMDNELFLSGTGLTFE